MALRYKKSFHAPLLWLCSLFAAFSCEVNYSREKDESIAAVSHEVCECFNKQKTGDIDARLTPCFKNIIHSRTATLPEGYSLQDSVAAVNAVNDSLAKDSQSIPLIMQQLVNSCDSYGAEIETMYDAWYPVDSSATNLNTIQQLADKLPTSTIPDTTKRILHALIARNIRARRLEQGLKYCQQMKKRFAQEGGAYFASAYVYNLKRKPNLAINELKEEIRISGDTNLGLFIAVTKRKARQNGATIN